VPTRTEIFERIWRENAWKGTESRSGRGSGVARTAPLRTALEAFLDEVRPALLYDAPCGDFVWMAHVRLPAGTRYLGADIVPGLIAENLRRHSAPHRRFVVADIVTDPPPPDAEVWLCRESLFHLSFADALAALGHWRSSGVGWLLATTTPTVTANVDVPTGGWRRMNLAVAPFDLGPPLATLPDAAPTDASKVVGVWRRPERATSPSSASTPGIPCWSWSA
jgi:hypothetical protein